MKTIKVKSHLRKGRVVKSHMKSAAKRFVKKFMKTEDDAKSMGMLSKSQIWDKQDAKRRKTGTIRRAIQKSADISSYGGSKERDSARRQLSDYSKSHDKAGNKKIGKKTTRFPKMPKK